MPRSIESAPRGRRPARRRSLAGALLGLALGACATASPPAPSPSVAAPPSRDEVIVRQEAAVPRGEDAAALRAAAALETAEAAFADCRDEGMGLEARARANANAGQYRRAALILEGCLAEAERSAMIAAEARLPVLAMAIQSHAKAGDVGRAGELLEQLETRFTGLDLYYADGTSFIESLRLALGLATDAEAGAFSTANVNPTLKADLRRQRYWQAH